VVHPENAAGVIAPRLPLTKRNCHRPVRWPLAGVRRRERLSASSAEAERSRLRPTLGIARRQVPTLQCEPDEVHSTRYIEGAGCVAHQDGGWIRARAKRATV